MGGPEDAQAPDPTLTSMPQPQLLKALDYLKEEFKVMHRDIKPSNVLLGYDGDIKVGSGHEAAPKRFFGCEPPH